MSDYVIFVTEWLQCCYEWACVGFRPLSPRDFLPRGLTTQRKCAKFQKRKGREEDTQFGKILREEPVGARLRNPAGTDTTSEPRGGNALPGAPVIASMSDGLGRNQGGTVEYKNDLYPTPDFVRGWDFFVPPLN